jgi:drug/metabolite transporter (DMT)-like permease
MAGEIGIILAALSLLCLGSFPIYLKKIVAKTGEYGCALLSNGVLCVLLAIVAVFTTRLKMPSDFVTAAIILGGLVGSFAFYIFYKALNSGHASVVVATASTYILWSAIISYFLFNTQTGFFQFLGLALGLIGLILVAMQKMALPKEFDEEHIFSYIKSDMWAKGAGLAILASLCFTIVKVTGRYGSDGIGPHRTLLYLSVLVVFFLLFAFLGRSAKSLVVMPGAGHRKPLWIGVSLFAAAAILFYFAIIYKPASFSASIISAAPLVTAIASAIMLKEKLMKRQYVGIVLLTLGLILITI